MSLALETKYLSVDVKSFKTNEKNIFGGLNQVFKNRVRLFITKGLLRTERPEFYSR